jgi:hypothetical protein
LRKFRRNNANSLLCYKEILNQFAAIINILINFLQSKSFIKVTLLLNHLGFKFYKELFLWKIY